MHCDQCEAVMINGVFCHETGCPNAKRERQWMADELGMSREEVNAPAPGFNQQEGEVEA